MADNALLDTGLSSTVNVATDDVGGVQYQRVKIDLGADGAASPLERGQQTSANSIPVVLASDQSVTLTADTEFPAAGALGDNAANPTTTVVGAFGMLWDGATWDRAKGDSTDGALVNLGTNNDVTVTGTVTANLAAGTNNIGDVDVLSIAAGDNNIGNVDVVTVPAPLSTTGGGTEATALRVTIATDSTGVVSVDDNGGTLSIDDGGGIITVDGSITADTELPAAAALADNTANPTTPSVGTFPHWFDGSTWDRALGNATDGLLVNLGANNDVTNGGTFAVQESGAALTALQLIDNPVAVLGTATYTEATTSGFVMGAVRRDADTTLVNTTNEIAPLIVDANGYLKVEIFDGGGSHTVDNNGTFVTQIDGAALTALQLIDDQIVTLGTDTYTEATSKAGAIGAVRRDADTTLVNTTNEWGPLQMDANGRLKVEVFDSGDSHTVDNGGTFAVQVDGAALTALQLIDDAIFVDDTATHSTGSTKIMGVGGVAVPTDTAISANDIGMFGMSLSRALYVEGQASENHIGEVGGRSNVYEVTLTTDTAAYASGDLIADTQQLDAFFRKTDGTGVINDITIIDEEAQNVAFYLYFMKTSTSFGTENSAPNISDANLSAGLIGIVPIATTDWVALSGCSVCCIKNIGLVVEAVSGTDDLYIAAVNSTGAPDWDADSLKLKIGTLLD